MCLSSQRKHIFKVRHNVRIHLHDSVYVYIRILRLIYKKAMCTTLMRIPNKYAINSFGSYPKSLRRWYNHLC
ncbi:hypothetical protein HanRHA438_Chr04g0190631 [Helianthus annuus]|nr:hypothetical protein HanIR_Chr04g0194641 [Helianthus annuus]KAJ0928130.1 hypothetical protein HanRHA438_Chr04g0190631 [Helianthus annuus]